MGRDPEAWTDRAFWSNDPNITTCKDIWGTSATAEGSEGRQGSWGNEAQGSSIGEGRADSEILQELESYRDPSKVRKSSESWDRSAVGPTFLRPTSAHSSRLRSTVVSPRILLTSGRSRNVLFHQFPQRLRVPRHGPPALLRPQTRTLGPAGP